ncbi:hypothetical protein [uncultured Mailhella sp.]|uniref:hypothetical protein n=1 Tax=uncultured Mailhella sp. TaxID=1981031 RepID=UPI0026060E19|nr:hypothetical protein [uncultured Mailhella sp.]
MADAGYIGENTDLVLGQEFLTWLWFRSETGNIFRMEHSENSDPFSVSMEQRIVVRGGEGENQETATVSGSFSPLREARLGLLTGKQVVRCLVRLEKDGQAWLVTLKAEDFSINSLRTPPISREDEAEDPDALFLEKVYLIEQGLAMFDEMYRQFLEVRLEPARWMREVKAVAEWMRHDVSQGAMQPQV